ncbi:MAG: BamA/TamA family outer membrane protein [Gemmatimonadota bacterium]|nr:MAG: BamA/TamA family outer membrane protein [Gemmatimonadota bacterium]
MTFLRLLTIGGLLMLPVSGVAAQDTVLVRPRQAPSRTSELRQWAVDFFNAATTTRVIGELTIESDTTYTGDLAVLDGPLLVEGTVDGTVVAINADVHIGSGASITGDVYVLGGRMRDEVSSRVAGSMRRVSTRVSVRLVGGRLELLDEPRAVAETRRRPSYPTYAGASILIGLGDTYNRVEGLPLRLGARFYWRGRGTRVELRGYGIFRTARELDTSIDGIGYYLDGTVRLGGGRDRYSWSWLPGVTLGGRAFEVVKPTLDWPLTLHEVGWASFLWRRDYRDYFLQTGFSGFVNIHPLRYLTLSGEVARVEEQSIDARDAWTPFRRDQEWRPNPFIDAGDYTLVTVGAEYDSRPSRRVGASGWYVRLAWDHGIGENIVENPLPASVRDPLPTDSYKYDRATIDLRRYQRFGRRGQFRLRALWAGTIGRDPLPIQRRYSLGGPDPLNGYAFRAFTCNEAVGNFGEVGLCDRILLFQAEYRGRLGFDWFRGDYRVFADDDDWGFWDWEDGFWFDGPTIILLGNAGTGWLDGQSPGPLNFDVGAGIEIGSVQFYAAKAIKEGEPVRVTLRIERRF